MDIPPPGGETPKDYATRRIDLEQSESTGEMAALEAEKKSRTRKISERPVEAPAAEPAVIIPVDDQPLPPPPSPVPTTALPGLKPKNDRIWIAAIIGICVVALACICSCTIVAAVFLSRPPW